jgi:hypothetical protein
VIQTTGIKSAKDIPLPLSSKGFACLVHHPPLLIVMFGLSAFLDLIEPIHAGVQSQVLKEVVTRFNP